MGSPIRDFTVREEVTLNELSNRGVTAAIDIYTWMYAFFHKIRGSDGEPLSDSQGRVTSHLSGLYYRTMNLLDAGIRPVFVFEGGYPDLKEEELQERRDEREQAQREYEVAEMVGDQERMAQLEIDRRTISEEMQKTAFDLIDAMGCPAFVPPEEAEPQCARMCLDGQVDLVISSDYDTLLYGSPNVVQDLTSSGGEFVDLQDSLSEHNLSHKELIWIGLMVGTDFNESPHGVGPVTAEKIAREADTIGDVIRACQEKDGSVDGNRWRAAYNLFARPEVDLESDWGSWSVPDRDRIHELLVEKHEFREDRVENALDIEQTEETINRPQQSSFGDF